MKLKLIGISEEHKRKLDILKKYPRETYDDTLKKILEIENIDKLIEGKDGN